MRPCTPIEDRFWPRVVEDPSGCWIWTGAKVKGYGRIGRGRAGEGNIATHVLAYELVVGKVPDGLELDHLCRNPACCNPAHLEPVTHRENILRSPTAICAIHARKTHCPRGHRLAGRNLVRSERGRKCRICHNARQRERERRKVVA